MPQCSKITLKGTQCSRSAVGSGMCRQHATMSGVAVPAPVAGSYKAPANVYATVSQCQGRIQTDCPPPACAWTARAGKGYCRSTRHTNRA